MKFQAFKCTCGYKVATPEEHPKCADCGKDMILMEKGSEEYKEFDKALRKVFSGA